MKKMMIIKKDLLGEEWVELEVAELVTPDGLQALELPAFFSPSLYYNHLSDLAVQRPRPVVLPMVAL